MKRKRKEFVPTYRLHKPSGQAIVEFEGKRVYLGTYDTHESRERYRRAVAEWLANGRTLSQAQKGISVAEMCLAYWQWCIANYPLVNERESSTVMRTRSVIRDMRSLYGSKKAESFKPKELKVLQQVWVERGFTRKTVNEFTFIVKRIFRWGVTELELPPVTYHGVQAVEGLRKGRSKARESKRVLPVPVAHVEAIEPFVSRQVWSMVQLQLLSGARGGELLKLRPMDIVTSKEVWTARLNEHKNAHRNQSRVLYFGPRSQAILRKFLDRPVDGYLFCPREAEKERRADSECRRRENQKPTPRKTRRTLGKHDTTDSYRRAVERACRKSGIPKWTPHQLRHTAATAIRREHGLDAAQVILGHATANVTQLYAEVDQEKAKNIIGEIG